MPGIVRSRASLDADESDSESASRDSTPQVESPNGVKRRRVNQSARPRESTATNDSWSLGPPPSISRSRSQMTKQTTPRRKHRAGMIVQVNLKDFLTYSKVTFNIGPSLNMVIGPNGTGKSSLVCAICLGLGWGPNQLGRAKDPGEFVKHGRHTATIEIELKGRQGQRNPIIRRIIHKENKSEWSINGQTMNQKRVQEFSRGFNIQIDNLCQFLPQDRVVEFSQMSPVEKLASTLQAAARPEMTEWFEELKRLRSDQKTQEEKQMSSRETLKNLEARQAAQEQDVRRLQERQQTEKELGLLEQTRPITETKVLQVQYEVAAERKNTLKEECRALKAETRPARNAVTIKESYKTEVLGVFERRRQVAQTMEKALKQHDKDKVEIENEIKKCHNDREAEREQLKKVEKEKVRIQTHIDALEVEMQQPAPDFDMAALSNKAREKTREIRELEMQLNEIRDSRGSAREEVDKRKEYVRKNKAQVDRLKSESGQLLAKLENLSKPTAKAWEWVQQNLDKFESEVFAPPILSCSIVDRKYADRIESMLQKAEFKAITCTTKKDFETLSRELQDRQKITELTLRNVQDQTLSDPMYRPPVNDQEKRELGIECWAIECIKGPEPVLVMLAGERNLHATAVFSQNLSDEQYQQLTDSAVSSWVTPQSSFRVMKRLEYGAHAVSTSTKPIRPARNWTNQPVDTQREAALLRDIAMWESEIEELEGDLEPIRRRVKDLEERKLQFEKENNELRDEKEEKQLAVSAYAALPIKKRSEEQKLQGVRKQVTEIQRRLRDIEDRETKSTLRRAEKTIQYAKQIEATRQAFTECLIAHLALIEATSDHDTLQQRIQNITDAINEKEKEYKAAVDAAKAMKSKKEAKSQQVIRLPEEVKEYFNSLPEEQQNRTLEDLDLELESLHARLEMLHGGNPATIREYEHRARRIADLSAELTTSEESLSSLDSVITNLLTKFEPALDALVSRINTAFSSSFEKINCAGAVDVDKVIDSSSSSPPKFNFGAWSIRIRVKFREAEPLATLDSHRQSGGERAVSTIFYLMALQKMSRAPFRVVDEINQGMDPRNERVVHERLVDLAVGVQHESTSRSSSEGDEENEEGDEDDEGIKGGSQYFLITPKLLPGLKYAEGMTVHTIVSGEFVPDDPATLDLSKFRDLVTRVRDGERGRAAAVAAVA